MESKDFDTPYPITWCRGCPNFGILQAAKGALADLVNEKIIETKDIVAVSGIGCHAKIYDYLNTSAFYGLHGRTLPISLGIKMGNPGLKVLAFAGDGDTFAEGIGHFINACRYNHDLVLIVHNNQVFGLTTGQVTPTSEKGYAGSSNPLGNFNTPLNPVSLSLAAGAGFVARGYASDPGHLKEILKEAVKYKGFAFVEVLQPCLSYHNAMPYFQKNSYKMENAPGDFSSAFEKSREWDYSFDKDLKIPLGIFYKKERPAFEENWPQMKTAWHRVDREIDWEKIANQFK